MSKSKILLGLSFCFLASIGIFQNCSEIESVQEAIENPQVDVNNAQPVSQTPPEFLENRPIPLDNKIFTGSVSLDLGAGDSFAYETDYLATFQSTLVTIQQINGTNTLTVISDGCNNSKTFTAQEYTDFQSLFIAAYESSLQRVLQMGETNTHQGGSFPRLVANVVNPAFGDIELFMTPVDQTPVNDLYITYNGPTTDPAEVAAGEAAAQQIVTDFTTYFTIQINQVCGL